MPTPRDLARIAYNAVLAVPTLLLRLAPRDPRRWTFAGCGGTRFSDNSAWLYLWTLQKRPEVRATWITRDRSVLRRLLSAGLPAALEWTPRGLWLQARGAVTLLSHGPGDLYHPATVGSYRVNLWHGLPIKHIMLDHPADHGIMRPRTRTARLYQQLRRPGLLRGPDLLMAMTPAGRRRMEQASGLPPERTSDAGFPRLQVRQARSFRGGRSLLVLFLPTWGTDAADRGRLLGPQVRRWMEANDAVLVLKPHPNDPAPTVPDGWERLAHVAPRTLDAMVLMREADVLVTDVSSALVDMLAAGRPALVVRTVWGSELRGFHELPETYVSTPVASDADGLVAALEDAKARRRRGVSNASAQARQWLPATLEDSCPRVFEEIQRRRPGGPA
jgi:CDP-glycerol glycerophosphotransferase (TagB/SpsB family)